MRSGTPADTEKSSEGNKMLKRLEKMEFKGTRNRYDVYQT